MAVDNVTLSIERGEMLALLGPSGSGKTTMLRLLAGFETPDAGRVLVEGEDVTRVEPVRRRFGMVFQHYALFPHLDVGENVGFGLESLGVRGEELTDRVARALALVDLAGLERRRIGQLSGGQQQRVALARALAPEPRVLLLDEPLSNLDPTLRERTRREIRELIRRVGITTVLVTHEQDEAFELGDRVAVLRGGRLEQVGTPDELYAAPANRFVGGFVGRSSVIPVAVLGPTEWGTRIAVEGVEWEVERPAGHPVMLPGPAVLLARPEALRLGDDPQAIVGTVAGRRFTGPSSFFTVLTASGAALEVVAPPMAVRDGRARRDPSEPSRRGRAPPVPRGGADDPPGYGRHRCGSPARAAPLAGPVPAGAGPARRACAGPQGGRSITCASSSGGRPRCGRCGAASGSRSRAWCWRRCSASRSPSCSRATTSRAAACWRPGGAPGGAAAAGRRGRVPLPLRRDRLRLAAAAAAAAHWRSRRGGWRAPGAILLVHAYSMYVYFYLLVRAALVSLDASQLEAAASLGAGRWRTLRRVVLPHLKPALAGAALLTFMTALASFSAPYIFGGGFRVMPTQIVSTRLNGEDQLAMVETIVAHGAGAARAAGCSGAAPDGPGARRTEGRRAPPGS